MCFLKFSVAFALNAFYRLISYCCILSLFVFNFSCILN